MLIDEKSLTDEPELMPTIMSNMLVIIAKGLVSTL